MVAPAADGTGCQRLVGLLSRPARRLRLGATSSDNDTGGVFSNADVEGAVIGGQVGVNWQWNYVVVGAEGDASWSGIDDEDLFERPELCRAICRLASTGSPPCAAVSASPSTGS